MSAIDVRSVSESAARQYLASTHPGELEAFQLTFDYLYDIFDRAAGARERVDETEGLPIDDAVVTATLVTIAVQVALAFAKAAARVSAARDLPHVLDKVEAALLRWIDDAALIRAIRERVEQILKQL